MPIGPSHSRGGGGGGRSSGGSHSSGGFSFSGSSGGRSYHSHHVPRVPIRLNLFGSRVVISTGKQTLLIFLTFLLIAVIFMCSGVGNFKNEAKYEVSDLKAYISQCELDAAWYSTAKTKAEAGNDKDFFVTYATNYDYYYDNDMAVKRNNVKFYYLIYQYQVPIDNNNDGVVDYYETLEGETYSSFSSSQAIQWDRKIFVGKDGGSWASMNYDYSLSTNHEYLFQKESLENAESLYKSLNTIQIILILAAVAIAIILILVIVKTIKKGKIEYQKEIEKKNAEVAEANANAEVARKKAAQISRVCKYCGSTVPDEDEKCPSCGASKFN